MKKIVLSACVCFVQFYCLAQTGAKVINFLNPGHGGYVNFITFSPSGKTILGGGGDGYLYTWNLSSDKYLTEKNLEEKDIYAAQYTPDEKYLLAGGRSGILYLCDAKTLSVIKMLDGFNLVTTINISPDSKTAYIGTGGPNKLVNIETLSVTHEIGNGKVNGWFSNDSKTLYHMVGRTEVGVSNVASGTTEKYISINKEVYNMALSPDNKFLIAGVQEGYGGNTILKLINMESGEIKDFAEKGASGDYAIPFSFLPGTTKLLYYSQENGLHSFDIETVAIQKIINDFSIFDLSISHDGKYIITREDTGQKIRVLSLQ